MAVVSPEQSAFLKISYPGEESDPFWDQWVEMVRQMDEAMFMALVLPNLFIAGGGTRTWNGGSGIFTWTTDFTVPVFYWGKKLIVRYGPDAANRAVTLLDGQALVVEVPIVLNNDTTVVNFSVVSQLTQSKRNLWIAGWRNGSVLQLKGIGELT